ncbi:sushi, von Willebrand factor type A, EGF and pentraxin domain-containing protein 1-like [Halichondria panicea]|uniref:sushi, von Willebrand factor type A, EGF and pentraxin domain-containing protein 1-like n=1 Tax=Halichondria panicea TaxID=6063 RepID=UPI00312B4874
MHRLSIITVVSCGSLPSISNRSPGTPTSTTFGGTGTYSCNTGYVLSGSATVNCEASGGWSTRPTCEIVSCGSLPSISNGSPDTPTSTTFGGTRTYSCNTGYILSGSATVNCEASGGWSTRPTCEIVSCGSLPSISNGSPDTPTSTTFGGTGTYSCNTGYVLSGSATVNCEASGGWSTRPTCDVISCGPLPFISNGSPDTPTSTSFGGTGTYSCNTGYVLSGSATVNCEGSGGWSTRPTCEIVSCGSLPSISNGSPDTPTSTSFGRTGTYSCNTGYVLSGSATVTCEASGGWSTRPTCEVISCGPLPSISNGSPDIPTSTTFGGTGTYSCNTGYVLLSSATVNCEGSGGWSTRPSCDVISCGPLPSIFNGSPGTPTSTKFRGTGTYSCNTGYVLSGSATVTCEASGGWSTRPSCDVISCGPLPSISNGSTDTPTSTTFRGTGTYSCNTGYVLSGSATVNCEVSGGWSTRPTCEVISCGPLPSISNGSPDTPTKTTFGGTGTYSCNTGYVLSGSATVTCEASGGWSTRPTCEIVSCGSLPSISNGSPDTPTSTTFGGTGTYSCNTGYVLSGSATVTCEASGGWSTRPTCEIVSCGSLPSISNGSPDTPTSTTFGGTGTYSCNTGYVLSGSATVNCEGSGSWNTRPTYPPVSCGDPPTIPNGSRTFTGTTYGDMAPYTPVTQGTNYQDQLQCYAWLVEIGILYQPASICSSPPSISNGSPGTPTSIIQGGTVVYSCNSGYQLLGSATVVCQDSGNWSPRPTCLTSQPGSCDNPPTIPNGSRTFVGTSFGDAAFYSCNIGYQLAESSIVTCQADAWKLEYCTNL